MIELAEKVQVKCFLCQRIVEKLKANLALSEAENYHITVDLAAIDSLRQETESAAAN